MHDTMILFLVLSNIIQLPRGRPVNRYQGYDATVSGFGKFSDYSEETSKKLKYVTNEIMSNEGVRFMKSLEKNNISFIFSAKNIGTKKTQV